MVSWVHSRRSLTCGYENPAFQAEKKILRNSYSIISDSMKYQICPIRSSIILWLLFFATVPLVAQTLPTPTDAETVHRDNLWNNYRIEQEIRQFRNQPTGVTISTPQLPPQLLDEKSDQKVLTLNDVIFFPLPKSIALEELQAIAQKYIRLEKISIRDLYQMLTEIDALFDTRHIVGRAVWPVQNIENGVVRIQIIEGKNVKFERTRKRNSQIQPKIPHATADCRIAAGQ
ncbi:MAG: hypothetical protein LBK82_03100 [Planctomycetaceae bacterium]|nr:hypothetical protein [Planctomycetaceae bacterium]